MVDTEFIATCCRRILPSDKKHMAILSGSRFVDDLGFDSLALVALILEIEEALSVSLLESVSDMVTLETIQDAVDYLNTKI